MKRKSKSISGSNGKHVETAPPGEVALYESSDGSIHIDVQCRVGNL